MLYSGDHDRSGADGDELLPDQDQAGHWRLSREGFFPFLQAEFQAGNDPVDSVSGGGHDSGGKPADRDVHGVAGCLRYASCDPGFVRAFDLCVCFSAVGAV